MEQFSIIQPDDWHIHLRDGDVLQHTVPAVAQHFSRALVMPNLVTPLTTLEATLAYRERILKHRPQGSAFEPYMTLYLHPHMQVSDWDAIAQHPFVLGAKLYPAGSTTHSEHGIHNIEALYPLFEVMQAHDLVLQIHGEVTFGDIFEREAVFITTQLRPLMQNFPHLRIVLEHISTQAAVDFVQHAPDTLAATITPHHLMYQRNDLLVGGIKPHYYCLPILKHENDRMALHQAAISGSPKFFAGTDSAPHAKQHKESACGCAGIYSSPYAVALYTHVFDELAQRGRLNDFMSVHGAQFYHLPVNKTSLTIKRQPQIIPAHLPLGSDVVIPISAGQTLAWSVHGLL